MKGICNKCAKKDGCDKYKELSKTDYTVVSCIDFIKDFETVATYYNAEVLDKIRAEIERVLNTERDFTTESAKAQAIALSWCIEIIDKYRKGANE